MIYFDNNATTQAAEEVIDAMSPYLANHYGNPSSKYTFSDKSRGAISSGRANVAGLLGAKSADEIVFTSGGTESDNWAIFGTLEANREKTHIITTRVEHEAVRKVCEKLEKNGFRITWLEVDRDGRLDLGALERALGGDTALVSVMHANNETGVLFPVKEIAEIVKSNSNAVLHVDGVNAAGKIPVNLAETLIDLYSISAHKFYGPKGIGALYIRSGLDLPSIKIGGGQESGRRAGTEAVHQIAGLGEAAKIASELGPMERIKELRDRLEYEILELFPNSRINGDPQMRLPNTSNISFENLNGEVLVAKLDAAGICVSTGSACNEENHEPSPVLTAMNIPYSFAMGSIRFSLGRFNTDAEVDTVISKLKQIVAY